MTLNVKQRWGKPPYVEHSAFSHVAGTAVASLPLSRKENTYARTRNPSSRGGGRLGADPDVAVRRRHRPVPAAFRRAEDDREIADTRANDTAEGEPPCEPRFPDNGSRTDGSDGD